MSDIVVLLLAKSSHCQKGNDMDLTREEALKLHREMWSDMQKKLGDNPSHDQRVDYKEKWVNEKFPHERVRHDCFLCEYVANYERGLCDRCPIDWGEYGCQKHPFIKGVDWRYSRIRRILALPERKT